MTRIFDYEQGSHLVLLPMLSLGTCCRGSDLIRYIPTGLKGEQGWV